MNLYRWASLPFFVAVVLAASGNQTVKRIGSGDIPSDQQTYDFSPENRCALLSHQSKYNTLDPIIHNTRKTRSYVNI